MIDIVHERVGETKLLADAIQVGRGTALERDDRQRFLAGVLLQRADVVFLCDLYPAREQPIEGVTSALIAGSMRESGKAPVWEGPRSDAAQAIAQLVRENDVVITIGAGDITRTGPELAQLLVKES